ncbi:MAG TPA: LysM domain-containing protein [Candidatus Angelobacter sp.]|jgi:hypothetical protein|nr:LysM domain-containing protein [Candidatus Angelobacter sp.]
MFASDSRYAKLATYTVTLPDGQIITAIRLPVPQSQFALAGYHTRMQGDRLDLLAARYLQNPTLFWKLCDANGTIAPAALQNRPLIGIPRGGQ